MLEVAQDAGLAVAPRRGIGLSHVDKTGDIDAAAGRIGAQRRRRLLEGGAIPRGLPGKLGEWRPARKHQAETHAAGDRNRAFGRAGQEHRRVRLLYGMGKQLVVAADVEPEVLAAEDRALSLQQLHQQRQRLLLYIAPRFKVDAKAIEFVFAVARAKA